jgi:hypothetical protein
VFALGRDANISIRGAVLKLLAPTDAFINDCAQSLLSSHTLPSFPNSYLV